jgi:hypothetical protein
MEAELSYTKADFALGSRLWKDPSANSYFVGEATGAASETQAWVLLPRDCAEAVPSGVAEGNVPVVAINAKDAQAPHRALAEAAMYVARHVADGLGCAEAGVIDGPVRLQDPDSLQPMDEANVCGVGGFQFPDAAVVEGQAEPGDERYTGGDPKTWACDLYLAGPGKPQITFAASEDPVLVGSVKLDKTLGTSGGSRVLRCEAGAVYAGMTFNDAYRNLLLDQGDGAYEKAQGELFESFLDALGKARGCPARAG